MKQYLKIYISNIYHIRDEAQRYQQYIMTLSVSTILSLSRKALRFNLLNTNQQLYGHKSEVIAAMFPVVVSLNSVE